MAPSYHLVYFDIRGRAEPIRILFALAGASYTEERVNPSEWPALKTSGRCPFGQVPVLELGDGKSLCQSAVILKYVANELGFSPSDSYAKAQAEMFVDSIKDFQNELQRLAREKAADPKDEKKSSLYDAEIAKTLEIIDNLLQQKNGGKSYLLPVLELGDGKSLCQSSVILRYVANELGFTPSDSYGKARAEVFVDALKDLENQFGRFIWEKDADRKAKMKSSLYDEEIPKNLEFIDKLFQQNNGGKGYLVGDKIVNCC
ncbi:probable glutathione S-transferase 6 [Exaiptasia diaphana]|uniref:Glutathione S-transferase n=1 Tax=Exaiptasia diaphana TaxID=2652724 RepID=A0A913YUY3_EXADI|nr:probable glutathione S-transferase 6 [Exaiptasia diaphana]